MKTIVPSLLRYSAAPARGWDRERNAQAIGRNRCKENNLGVLLVNPWIKACHAGGEVHQA